MKSKFSTSWNRSIQPRKQRKYGYNAPLHLRHKVLSAPLSKDLKKKYNLNNLEVRKGDEVKVLRGKFKKKSGKIGNVNLKKIRISIEGIERSKKDGGKVPVWFNPSKVMIITLNMDDKKRLKHVKKIEETKPEGEKNVSKKK